VRERAEVVVAGILAVIAAALHFIFFRSAGAFWRDEAISIRVATSPSLSAMLHRFYFDAALLLSSSVLRLWIDLTGLSQPAIRMFGLIAGLLALIAAAVAIRLLGGRIPVIAFAILGMNGDIIRYGDSIRSYGVGMVTCLLAFGTIGYASRTRSTRGWLYAGLAAAVSVQATYQNSILVFACCIAAACVQPRREIWKPLAAGACSAVTLLPYAGMMSTRLNDMFRSADVTLRSYASAFAGTLGIVSLVVFCAALLWARRLDYATLAAVLFVAVHFVYIRWVGYTPQPWYFVLPIAVIAVAADVSLGIPALARAAVAVLVAVLAIPSVTADITQRQTNIDDAASVLNRDARTGDFIVVYPWYVDTSFSMYYRGTAGWQSLPPIADHSVQRLDLAARAALTPGVEAPVAERAAAALRTGHRVWLVGFPLFKERPRDRARPTIPEAADMRWSAALADVLRHSHAHTPVVIGSNDVIVYERVNVVRFE
jgi:hypothetical protein